MADRWWLVNGYRWAENLDALAGPLVVCDRAHLLRSVEEGRIRLPKRRRVRQLTIEEER